MSIKLNGSNSGSVELDVLADAGLNTAITFPATSGDAVVKATDGSVDLGNVTIDSSGRVEIGTAGGSDTSIRLNSSTSDYLEFSSEGTIGYIIAGHPTTGGAELGFKISGGAGPVEAVRIDSSGAISTTAGVSPGASTFGTALGRAGNPGLIESYRNGIAGTGVCNFGGPLGNALIKCDGDLENTNNRYTGISDIKLKENIVDAASQWADIKNLKVRNYNFKSETGFSTHTQIGLVAQEVELVSPGLVGETLNEDTGELTKNVAYSVLYMKAVKALQEAMERIETLEASNAALDARLTALEGGAS